MEESTAEFYYKQLLTTTNPIKVLVEFAKSALGSDLDNQKLYPMLGRISKVFGTHDTYMAILDCALVENLNTTNLYGLIMYFAKKRFEDSVKGMAPQKDLTSYIQEKLRFIASNTSVLIPDIAFGFEVEDNYQLTDGGDK